MVVVVEKVFRYEIEFAWGKKKEGKKRRFETWFDLDTLSLAQDLPIKNKRIFLSEGLIILPLPASTYFFEKINSVYNNLKCTKYIFKGLSISCQL